jgi:hypothetical protein
MAWGWSCLLAVGFIHLGQGIAFEVEKYFNLNANSFSREKSSWLYLHFILSSSTTARAEWQQYEAPRHSA